MVSLEQFFRLVPGHQQRIRRRNTYGFHGIGRVVDVLLFGIPSRRREKKLNKAIINLSLQVHHQLYDSGELDNFR